MAGTGWPFLAGLAVGLDRGPGLAPAHLLVPTGLVVWISCVAVGMVLRVVAGQGTAVAFVLVALAFLGLELLGWRALAGAARKARTARRPARSGVGVGGGPGAGTEGWASGVGGPGSAPEDDARRLPATAVSARRTET